MKPRTQNLKRALINLIKEFKGLKKTQINSSVNLQTVSTLSMFKKRQTCNRMN